MPGSSFGNRAQLEACAPLAVVDELGQRVGEPAGADVVDRQDGVRVAQRRAAVDHLLAAALHLGVVALDRGEVEVLVAPAARHRRRGAAAEPDQHRRSAEHADRRAGGDAHLLDVPRPDVAEAAREHDRLVVAPHLGAGGPGHLLLVGAEVAAQRRPPVLVVEGGRADRSLEHDLERRGDAIGLAEVGLPGLQGARDPQVRDAEARQPRLRLRAAAGGALVADLAARARGRAGKRRDRGRMVVGLDLHQDVHRLGDARRRRPSPGRGRSATPGSRR